MAMLDDVTSIGHTNPADVDIDEWLYPDDELPTDVTTAAPPPDADRADRMLAARRRQLARITEVQQLAAARRAEIDEWETAQLDKLTGRIDWLDASLTAWHAAVLRADKSRTSIELPNGTLKATKVSGGAEWEWVDDQAVTEYLQGEAPGLVTWPDPPPPPKPRPDKKAVKTAIAVVADVAAARDDRRAFVEECGPRPGEAEPPRFVAGTGVDGELVPVLDLDTGQPVPGVMVRRLARRYRIETP